MAAQRRIVILGHTGFIGRHLLRGLRAGLAPPGAELLGMSRAEADLTRPEETARLAPVVTAETTVVLCSGVQKWVEDSRDSFFRNLAILSNVLGTLESTPPRQLVFFSSAAVYGETRDNAHIREETPAAPSTHYGAAKFAAECLLSLWSASHPRTALCILRPSLVYGADNPESQYLPRQFAARIVAGDAVTLWGDGRELRNFIHVDDVAQMIGRIVREGTEGLYNAVSPFNLAYRDFAVLIGAQAGLEAAFAERPRTRPKVDLAFDLTPTVERIAPRQFTSPAEGAAQIVRALSTRLA